MSIFAFQESDLVGAWVGKAADATECRYVFNADGSVINLVESEGFKQWFGPLGVKAKYKFSEKSSLWELDIYDFENFQLAGITFFGIVEPMDKQTFKMQGMPSNHGGRPGSFNEEAIIFTKVNSK